MDVAVALKGIMIAILILFGGVFLQRSKVIEPRDVKSMAVSYAKMFLPCLLFTRVARTVNSFEDLSHSGYMTIANCCVVGVGTSVGFVLRWLCRPALSFRKAFVVCVWMQNAAALPIVLAGAVITFDPHFADEREAAIERAIGFIAFYSVSNQFFQVGDHL